MLCIVCPWEIASIGKPIYVLYCLWEIASIGKPIYVLYCPWEIASIGKPIGVFVLFVCGKLRHRQTQI